ncbi:hypothetical protein DPMN_081542 [Dreissena polymorpha]|uniref:Uncharacterized protein n=1 Tax=Dreissena polymorpha TaxID=45954 RepID=A0A9D4BHV9_DREPO|nr:hypothetical protein DPMN_081542 [Dreissena polymorpha]
MFISRLLREYKYSEPDLEESRMMCFEALKAYDDFPFGVQADLNGRVTTRKGEKLSVKLATDIYKLVSVMEGGDYCDIRELISLSKSRPSQGKTPKKTITGADVSCFMTSGEVLLLKDNVTALQTDVLNMKQMLHAAEKIRSDQMKTFTNSLQVIKCDLLECKQFMSNCLNNFNLSVNDLKLTLQPLESAILAVSRRVSSTENILYRTNVFAITAAVQPFEARQNIPPCNQNSAERANLSPLSNSGDSQYPRRPTSPPNAVIISACDEAAPTYSPPNQEPEVDSEWQPLCSPGGIHHSVGTKSPTDVIIVPDSGHASKRTSTSGVSYGLITPTGALPRRLW